ncbi:hypothetical protein SLEP1_g43670 [Rubroshorea leprosula]|uniref:Metacaspase n=1 Tax=Rubroshorea leprosula TaxID=152421 RepID=A0AAV5LE92_9ROSI|nr:hypothetical protein SLEP1_g43670 [Rubroshorea leprosula]
MASRTERCSGCQTILLIPPEAQTIRCAVCQSISTVRPYDHRWNQIHNAFGAVNRVRYRTSYPTSGTICSANSGDVPPPRPVLSLPSTYGKKRALLCGLNYRGKSYGLKGGINDVKCMKYLLTQTLGFPSDSILMLTEDETDPFKIPTKQNIRKALRWLVEGCQSGDSLVFHYSGHSSRQRDYDKDELDGFDEALCPLDHETEGLIIDDEINATIVRPLSGGVTLHTIIDACYSGTMLDLPFLCRMNREGYYIWEDHRRSESNVYKGTSGGLALCFSACDDDQISADTTAFTGTKTRTGAMTFSFIQAVQNEPGLTYGRLLTAMRSAIREAKNGLKLNGPIAALVNKALFRLQPQEPQLSSSEKFDIYSRKFVL